VHRKGTVLKAGHDKGKGARQLRSIDETGPKSFKETITDTCVTWFVKPVHVVCQSPVHVVHVGLKGPVHVRTGKALEDDELEGRGHCNGVALR